MFKFCLPHRVLCLMFITISQNFVNTVRLPVPGHFYSCVVSKYLLRENEISFLLL